MSYQLYRNTTLGHTLQESLDELIQVRLVFNILTTGRLIWLVLIPVWTDYANPGHEGAAAVRQVHKHGAL